MRHTPIVAKYKVDGNHTIKINFEVGDDYLQVEARDPKWKPGSIVTIDEETMSELREGLLDYTKTGEAPKIGSDKTRL